MTGLQELDQALTVLTSDDGTSGANQPANTSPMLNAYDCAASIALNLSSANKQLSNGWSGVETTCLEIYRIVSNTLNELHNAVHQFVIQSNEDELAVMDAVNKVNDKTDGILEELNTLK